FLNHLAVRQAHVHPGSALRALSWLLAHAGTPVDRTVKKRRICAAVYKYLKETRSESVSQEILYEILAHCTGSATGPVRPAKLSAAQSTALRGVLEIAGLETPPGLRALLENTEVSWTEPSLPTFTQQMRELEVQFERALSAITMYFQPIVFTETRAVFGYEALVRSNDPDLPDSDSLLEAAERLNRRNKLGRHVRAQIAQIFARAEQHHGVVFVKLHPLDLLDKSLWSPFSPLAKIARRVVLEILERASLQDVSDLRFRIAELRQMGFRIAVDNMGRGHARMNLLEPLDIDIVKLDMSLVRDIDTHLMKQTLVRSITNLSRQQRIVVIGTGVETQAEYDFLASVGCELVQGYFIARPGPPFVSVPRQDDPIGG
ncbi:MAG: EAL domain-containing protein, partial [Proteobacteria bacterium]|nr:EAL domain-containing protein [Pseudomonadota bacterium]